MASLLPFSFGVRYPPRAAFTTPPPPTSSSRRELRIPYELKQGQSRVFHELPSGLAMEAIVHKGRHNTYPAPPLVFVHGGFHAAWCWAEHWLPFFSRNGHDCYAISLLAQGESDAPSETVAGTLQTHTNDIADFIREEVKFPPVLIGHSLGGLIVQSYVANFAPLPSRPVRNDPSMLAGAIVLCSTPLSGNSGLIWRYLFTRPIDAVKAKYLHRCIGRVECQFLKQNISDDGHVKIFILGVLEEDLKNIDNLPWFISKFSKPTVTRSLAAKAFATSLSLCKETFFSSSMDDHLVERYQDLMKVSSRLPLFDLRKLNGMVPVPSVPKDSVPILVVGARDDSLWQNTCTVVLRELNISFCSYNYQDMKGVEETARFYNVDPVILEGVAHDVMLDTAWEKGAEVILSWLNDLSRQSHV